MGHFSSERWSFVTTIVSSSISLTVLILFGLKFATGSDISILETFNAHISLLAIAGAHCVFSLFITPVLLKKNQLFAGYINLILLGGLIGSVLYTNTNIVIAFYTLWLLYIFLTGLYHWSLSIISGMLGAGFLYVSISENGEKLNSEIFFLIVLTLVTTAATIILWGLIKKGSAKHHVNSNASALQTLELEALIDSIGDGVVVINKAGQIEVFNPAAVAISGWEENEALGLDHRSVFALLNTKELAYSEDDNPILQALKTEKAVVDNSCFLQTRSKKNIDVDILASPIKTETDGLVGAVVIFRDVSKARSEERQRAEFISTASHEMRTPVASIEGYLALALNEKVSKIDDAARTYLEKAHKSTQHLGRLFQDLLTAAKTEDGRLANHPVVIDMGELLDEMTHDMQFSATDHNLTLRADFGGGMTTITNETVAPSLRPVAYVHVDPERIREVITNLFDNAIKYTAKGAVTLSMSTTDTEVLVSISDTGIGIAREDLPHLFQKFYRIDSSDTRQVGGTGLGLFISKKILELYKGKISVDSELGKGSTFTIRLPRISAEEASKMKLMEANQINPINPDALPPVPPIPTIELKENPPVKNEEEVTPQEPQVVDKPPTETIPEVRPQAAAPVTTQTESKEVMDAQPTVSPQKPHVTSQTQTRKTPVSIRDIHPKTPAQPRAMATYVKVRSHPDRPPRAKIYMPDSSAQNQSKKPTSITKINTA